MRSILLTSIGYDPSLPILDFVNETARAFMRCTSPMLKYYQFVLERITENHITWNNRVSPKRHLNVYLGTWNHSTGQFWDVIDPSKSYIRKLTHRMISTIKSLNHHNKRIQGRFKKKNRVKWWLKIRILTSINEHT